MYYTTTYDSPLGEIMIAADSKGIAGLWIQGQKYFEDMGEAGATSTAEFIPGTELGKDNEIKQSLDMACRWLDRYFTGDAPEPGELPLAPAGSEFRRMVWKILCEIPSGKTTTYGEIAKQIADMTGRKTMSAQAVGGAVGHNPVPQGGRDQREPDRIRRRYRQENSTAETGRCGYGWSVRAEKRNSALKYGK